MAHEVEVMLAKSEIFAGNLYAHDSWDRAARHERVSRPQLTLSYQTRPGWFVTGSAAHTWRSQVTLDRPYYFTQDTLFLTDKVDMPSVVDSTISAGYHKRGLMAQAMYMQQRTRGGGDIRRQDMPFVSNRMNFSRVGGMVMYPIPKLPLVFEFAYAYTVDGRNVGQAKTITTGLMYRAHSSRRPRS